MTVQIFTELHLHLTCDAGNRCRFQEPDGHGYGGSMHGGFEGKTKEEVFSQAKKRGWTILADKAICPDCTPVEILQEDYHVDDICPIDLEIFL